MPTSRKLRSGPADKLIGQRIKLRRHELGMTQAQLGAALDPPRSLQQIQKYEAGTNRVSSTAAMQISDFLQISLGQLLGAESAPHDATLQLAAKLQKLNPRVSRALLKLAQALVA
jgi:transcriptional regulator with XRE-family HTH domain